jgi:glyoxylase-like metal-dependent hydrolase (beta-lactamase superfamily II)
MDLQIGRWRVRDVLLDRFRLDGGAMFGVVPRALWSVPFPPDEQHRIELVSRALLLEDGERTVLVDTGMGGRWTEQERARFGVEPGRPLSKALAERELGPDDITDVLLTHLHFDHAGGAVTLDGEGRPVPAFPSATYHVQRDNLDWALSPTERDRGSYRVADFQALLDVGCLRVLEGPGEVFEGVDVRMSNGHTTGLQIPVISDGQTALVYPADLIPTHAHVALAWAMAYDLRPLEVLEEKRALLHEVVEEDWIVFYEHDPGVVASRVRSGERGFEACDNVTMGEGR